MRLDYVQACDRCFAERTHRKVPKGYADIARLVAAERRQRAIENEGSHPDDVPLERVSGSSLKGWYGRWRKGGKSIVALIPLDDLKGRAGFRLDPEVEMIIAERVREDWLTRNGPPLSHVIVFIQGRIERENKTRTVPFDVPDGMTIRRWVKANVSQFDVIYHREGPAAAEQAFRHVKKAPRRRGRSKSSRSTTRRSTCWSWRATARRRGTGAARTSARGGSGSRSRSAPRPA